MRLLYFSFAVLLAFQAQAFDPCSEADRAAYKPFAERYRVGLLIRIERCQLKPSYLFGTMHSDDPAVAARAAPAFSALTSTRTALFEIVSDSSTQTQAVGYMLLPPQGKKGLVDLIGQERFGRLVALLRQAHPEIPPQLVNHYRPWAAAVLLALPKKEADGVVLDEKLQQAAREQGITLAGLESVADQFQTFVTMPEHQQISMLDDTLARFSEMETMNRRLESDYRRGDLKAIHALGEESIAAMEDSALSEKMRREFLIERNARMTSAMLPTLAKGSSFIAIGALHLWGDQGVIHGLEQAGYFLFPEAPPQ